MQLPRLIWRDDIKDNNTSTCIIIPCHNEEDRFKGELFSEFAKEYGIHFLLVNDGSSDNTIEILKRWKNENPEAIDVLNIEKNGGKAEAVRHGINQALKNGYQYLGFWDADLATPLNEINNFLRYFDDQEIKAIFGSRVLRLGGQIKRKWMRHILGRIFATTISVILDLPVYDTQCGAKIFKKEVAEKLFDKEFASPWFFDVEILFRAKKLGLNCKKMFMEVPLKKWVDVDGSKLKMFDFIKVPTEILKICFKYR